MFGKLLKMLQPFISEHPTIMRLSRERNVLEVNRMLQAQSQRLNNELYVQLDAMSEHARQQAALAVHQAETVYARSRFLVMGGLAVSVVMSIFFDVDWPLYLRDVKQSTCCGGIGQVT
jgi:predicted PurR-regulated permease PerM